MQLFVPKFRQYMSSCKIAYVCLQILVLVTAILLLALSGNFEPGERGAVYFAAILLYAATAGTPVFRCVDTE